jgi:hypothetical protein
MRQGRRKRTQQAQNGKILMISSLYPPDERLVKWLSFEQIEETKKTVRDSVGKSI